MKKRTFLLADDDVDDKELFGEALTSIDKNIICHITSDGQQALSKLESLSEMPDLIFLDINMPVMNGWECIETLKKDHRYKNIPVVIISTSSHQRERDTARKLGALCFLTKPNEFDELKRILQAIVTGLDKKLSEALDVLQANSSYVFRLQ